MAHRIHSSKAKHYVRIAQMAGVAIGMSAAVLWAVDVPGLGYQEPKAPEVPPSADPQPQQTAELRLERERTEDIAVRLEMGVRRPPGPEPEPHQAEDPTPQPEAPASGPVIVYLGPIYEPDRMLAVVSVDGRQRIVSAGRLIGNLRLTAVRDHEIVVSEDGRERTIALNDRTGPSVSWLPTLPSGPAAAQQAAARRAAVAQARTQQSASRAGFSPEMEQRFRDRGIDPAQAARWREMMRERQAGRTGDATPTTLTEEIMELTHTIDDEGFFIDLEDGEEIEDDELRQRIEESGDEELLRRMEEEGADELLRRMREGTLVPPSGDGDQPIADDERVRP